MSDNDPEAGGVVVAVAMLTVWWVLTGLALLAAAYGGAG